MGLTRKYKIDFEGVITFIENQSKELYSARIKRWANSFMDKVNCETCGGSRLNKQSNFFKISNKTIHDLSKLDIIDLKKWFDKIESKLDKRKRIIGSEIIKEINKRLDFLLDVGLDYLSLNRPVRSLSGGESQRIRLATQIGSQLVGVLYILDEPSIGLHQRDNSKLIDSLKKLRDLWNKELSVSSSSEIYDSEKIESKFGELNVFEQDSLEIKNEELKRFGSDFFKNKNIVEVPQLYVATPSDYRLGPGDELVINLYGAYEITYSVQISRNGNVKFDKLGPVYLSGLSISAANKRLKSRLSKIYTGLNSNNPIEKVDLELNLQKARTIVVNITGQVEAPGTYTISGFSSVLNALYAAGGPNEVGTYRDIKILRSGRVVHTVDLYDYFTNGIYPNVYLRDQDVILVRPYQIQTELATGFNQLSLFELKKGEVVLDLINLSGGASSNAFKKKLFIERFVDFSKTIVEIDEENFSSNRLFDGDKISFKEIKNDNVSNIVKIGGTVNLEGNFQLDSNKTVNELINSAKGFSSDKLGFSAILYKNNKGLNNEVVSLNWDDSSSLQYSLSENDSLYVPSTKDVLFDLKIEIRGEVNFPKEIDFRFGLTITDLINMSGGLTPYANPKDIRVFRNVSKNGEIKLTDEIVLELDDNLIPNNKISLLPDDIVTVNTYPYRKDNKFYSVKGEVALPGLYSIKNQNY